MAAVPSGVNNARYSPSAESLKLVCSGAPGVARSLPEAKTIIKDLGGMLVAGKRHLPGLPALSVNAQLSRLTLLPDVFWISIQSEESPSSSTSVLVLLAMNSVMRTWAVAGTASDAINRTTENEKKCFIKKFA